MASEDPPILPGSQSSTPPRPESTPPVLSAPQPPPPLSSALTQDTAVAATPSSPETAITGPVLEGRLHPLTIVMALLKAIRQFAIPALIVLFTGSAMTLGIVLLGFLGLSLVAAALRYVTFTYRVEGGELITRQGVLERQERHIPLTRVQDLRLEQGMFHRILGVVDLHVETAGGTGAEASLSVLSRADAEVLRTAVFEQVEAVRDQATSGAVPVRAAEEILRRLTPRELVYEGLTSNRAASALVIVAAATQFLDDIFPPEKWGRMMSSVSDNFEQWVAVGGIERVLLFGSLGAAVILLGVVFSVIGSLVLFHGFTLSRRGEDLYRTYGLLTRRASSLPRRRLQLLKIEEPWLRRLFRMVTLRADTAGSAPVNNQENKDGRDVLLPILRREEVPGLLPVFFPDLEPGDPDWQDVSRCAIRRGTKKGVVVCVLLAAISWGVQQHLWSVWPLLLIPVVYVLNVLNYKHLGYVLGERFFRTRRGWLSRTTHIVPIRNVQTIVVRQNPFDRRFQVGTLMIDTAGQAYTGGGPHIRNVPFDTALEVGSELARRAAQTRFRW